MYAWLLFPTAVTRYLTELPSWLYDDPRGPVALMTTAVIRNILWIYPPFHVAKGYSDIANFAAYVRACVPCVCCCLSHSFIHSHTTTHPPLLERTGTYVPWRELKVIFFADTHLGQ